MIRVRPATPDDATTLASLLTGGMRYKQRHGDESWDGDDYTIDEVLPLLEDTYLVYDGDQLVGTVALQWSDPKWDVAPEGAGYIHRMAIKDGFHGHAIGAQILDWAMSVVKERQGRFLRLSCYDSNTALCAYYEKQSFKRVRTHKVLGADRAMFERDVNN